MQTINAKTDGDLGYVFFYNGKSVGVYAKSLYAAQQLAIAYFKPPASKRHLVRGMVAENSGGTPIVHAADF